MRMNKISDIFNFSFHKCSYEASKCIMGDIRAVWLSWKSDCSRRRRCRIQILEKHNNFQKPFWIFLGHIISSVLPTRWTRVISSRFNREIVTTRELCQVSWLWNTLAGNARTKMMRMISTLLPLLYNSLQ